MTPDDVAVPRQKGGMRRPPVLPRPVVLALLVLVGTTLATMGWLVGLFGLAYGYLPAVAIGAVAVTGATILLAVKIERLGWVLFVSLGVPALALLVLSRL